MVKRYGEKFLYTKTEDGKESFPWKQNQNDVGGKNLQNNSGTFLKISVCDRSVVHFVMVSEGKGRRWDGKP